MPTTVQAADVTELAEAAQRTIDTLTELSARWHRAEARKHSHHGHWSSEQWLYQDGMQAGWVQAIALLTGSASGDVGRQLLSGAL